MTNSFALRYDKGLQIYSSVESAKQKNDLLKDFKSTLG